MMMSGSNSKRTLLVLLQFQFLLLSIQHMRMAECEIIIIDGINATKTIADLLPNDEEFMMESETNRRLLGKVVPPITPPSGNRDKSFCYRDVYGSCIPRPNKIYDERPCSYTNTCARPGN